jgi:DNA-binding FadR family transcriptional regulator
MATRNNTSEFIEYLLSHTKENPDEASLPSLNDLSKSLGISVARLREQLEAAKTLGLVDVRPRTGIKLLSYSFYDSVWHSLSYAIELDYQHFSAFASLREHLELAYWDEAVHQLTAEDYQVLKNIIDQAWEKLRGIPVRVPHEEHRELHLSIYRRLNNPFVFGILESYWSAYEAVGLSLYTDLNYLEEVWSYHEKMVDAICSGDFKAGYDALAQHADLLHQILRKEE